MQESGARLQILQGEDRGEAIIQRRRSLHEKKTLQNGAINCGTAIIVRRKVTTFVFSVRFSSILYLAKSITEFNNYNVKLEWEPGRNQKAFKA